MCPNDIWKINGRRYRVVEEGVVEGQSRRTLNGVRVDAPIRYNAVRVEEYDEPVEAQS